MRALCYVCEKDLGGTSTNDGFCNLSGVELTGVPGYGSRYDSEQQDLGFGQYHVFICDDCWNERRALTYGKRIVRVEEQVEWTPGAIIQCRAGELLQQQDAEGERDRISMRETVKQHRFLYTKWDDVSEEFRCERVVEILEHAHLFDWTIQGFGMLRLTFPGDVWRLHVWSHEDRVPGVSKIHNHPWDFASYVLNGTMVDICHELVPGVGMAMQKLLCGPGARLEGDPVPVGLKNPAVMHTYKAGDFYEHYASDMHESHPSDGAVTLVRRVFRVDGADDLNHAHVMWPVGTNWVSAEPRAATSAEVVRITRKALQKWWEGA